jgi:hypothetical protein
VALVVEAAAVRAVGLGEDLAVGEGAVRAYLEGPDLAGPGVGDVQLALVE